MPALHAAAANNPEKREKTIYACYLGTKHLVRRKASFAAERASSGFDADFRDEHYFANPGVALKGEKDRVISSKAKRKDIREV